MEVTLGFVTFDCVSCKVKKNRHYNSTWNGFPVCDGCIGNYRECSDCHLYIRKDNQESLCPECKEN